MTMENQLSEYVNFEQAGKEANDLLKKLFEVPDNYKPLTPDSADRSILYGKDADEIMDFKVGERKFGAEIYLPEKSGENIWTVAQHGYAGRAKDFSKLAELLNKENIGLLSLDMHIDGKDNFKKMSMIIDEWADVAIKAPDILKDKGLTADKLIFVGQSSGGSSGAEVLTRGKEQHPYNGSILISPTLITPEPELVEAMDEKLNRFIKGGNDVMLDWAWLAPLMQQMHNKELNLAYQSHFTTTAGFPYNNARECYAIPEERIIKKFKQIDIPMIITKGEYDKEDLNSIKTAIEELKNNPNRNIKFNPDINDVGHQAHIEKPEAIFSLIINNKDFLCHK